MKKRVLTIVAVFIILLVGLHIFKKTNTNYTVGQEIDHFNGVPVYYNGTVGNVEGRQVTQDGYNLGLKYQCVEFVKRYYYDHLDHKMPDSYGHAKDFFDRNTKDGEINKQRALSQFTNPSTTKPKTNDLLVYGPTLLNKYGHVAIISKVTATEIEIIQQNPGPYGNTREHYDLVFKNDKWYINHKQILGWLRK